MQVETQILPAVNHIVAECEKKLSDLCGFPVRCRLEMMPYELNDTLLQQQVCDAFSVGWHQIIGRSRKAYIVEARHTYWYLSAKLLSRSVSELGDESGRDHSSVCHGRDKIREIYDVPGNPLAHKVRKIEESVKL